MAEQTSGTEDLARSIEIREAYIEAELGRISDRNRALMDFLEKYQAVIEDLKTAYKLEKKYAENTNDKATSVS